MNATDMKTNDDVTTQPNERELTHVQLSIGGMSCQSCASRIEKLLANKYAIDSATVNMAGEMASIDFDAEQVGVEQIIKWIEKAGFTASVFPAMNQKSVTLEEDEQAKKSLLFKLKTHWRYTSLFVASLLFAINMLGMLFGLNSLLPIWLQFIIATFVQLVLAQPFYRGAWSALKNKSANMDVLVSLGSSVVWIYSTFAWLLSFILDTQSSAKYHIYFETGVMIIAFITLGKYLEHRTKKNSLNSIEMMLSLVPTLVEKQSDIGEFYDIDLIDVKIGDVLRAKQGTRVATDGVVIEGEGWCDESHLTGESQLLAKELGDKILAGALVENGSLVYRVTATGEESQLGDMINALNEAQNTKAPIAHLADMVANYFVPFVLLASVVTFITTINNTHSIETSILYSVAVLVVACPCAMGLATPSAIMAGMGLAVRHGILFKNAEALERAGNIDTVVFDKTGTLTEGRPTLVAHLLMDKTLRYNEVLQLAASVEAHASHPLATTLVESAKKDNLSLLPVTDVKVIAGQGIQGQVGDLGLVKVGSSSWLDIELPKHIAKRIPKVLQSSSLVAVSIDDIPLGLFAFADKLRPDALATINQLKEFNVNIILMSGDRLEVVEHINEELQIGEAYSDMTPRDKAEKVKELQAKGKKVAMVGDGVNDSPAMATADASFALIDGTDIAKNTASACIMGDSLLQVLEAVHVSKLTVKHIRQSLFFAFIYNFLAIPLASYGFLNPMFAAGLMALSSISVLMNALRLNRYQF